MTFEECINFCKSHKDVIGTRTQGDLEIAHLVPAPVNTDNFNFYIQALYKNEFDPYKAIIVAGLSAEYEPFVICIYPNDDIDITSFHAWYSYLFLNEKPVAE